MKVKPRVNVLDAVNACNARMVLRDRAVSDVNVFGRDGHFHWKASRMNVLQRRLMLIVRCVRDWVMLMDAPYVGAMRMVRSLVTLIWSAKRRIRPIRIPIAL